MSLSYMILCVFVLKDGAKVIFYIRPLFCSVLMCGFCFLCFMFISKYIRRLKLLYTIIYAIVSSSI